jgi:hypothetical protein
MTGRVEGDAKDYSDEQGAVREDGTRFKLHLDVFAEAVHFWHRHMELDGS